LQCAFADVKNLAHILIVEPLLKTLILTIADLLYPLGKFLNAYAHKCLLINALSNTQRCKFLFDKHYED